MSVNPVATEVQNRLKEVGALIQRVKEASRFEDQLLRLSELEASMGKDGFWDDPDAAKGVIAELKRTKTTVDGIRAVDERLQDVQTLFELATEEDDQESLDEANRESQEVATDAEALELRTLLSGRYDSNSCYLSIHAGAGGTDACDWVGILTRMYLRWGERHRYKTRIVDELPDEEAGSKGVTLHLSGEWAYGYLRAEIGVHRLVRLSPFDAKNRRHTSFASVDVSPEVEDEIDIEIADSEIRVDTYRASGAGGQHVNVTDSAVRITHIPTGIVVQCQNERSQHANRAQAMKVLKSRILFEEEQKREAELSEMSGEKGNIEFGNQIRSYVMHPYKMVKDHRTEVETGNVDATLDGDLDGFIEAFLRLRARTE